MSDDSAYAAAPFDHPKADVILRSSDNINFRVFKLFLSLASPFFKNLFSVPQPVQGSEGQEIKDGLVVVPVTEDSKTLDALLRFCYPCTLADDPSIEVLKDAMDVLEAARKYSLDVIEKKARQALSNPKFLEADPLRCFVFARRGQMQEETLLAAKYALTQPLLSSWFEEIDLIPVSDLLALLTYHQECGNAVYALGRDLSWVKSYYRTSQDYTWLSGEYHPGFNCACPRSPTPQYNLSENYSLQWWEDFMKETFAALREKPCGATVASLAATTVQSVKGRNCPGCSARITDGMSDFSDLLTRKVEEVVSRIELDFSVPRNIKIHSECHSENPGQKSRKKGTKGTLF